MSVQEQPRPIPAMNAAYIDSLALDRGEDERDWKHDLCESPLEDMGTCCFAALCPSLVRKRNKRRLKYLKSYQKPHPDPSGIFVDDDGDCSFCVCFDDLFECIFDFGCNPLPIGLGWISQARTRGKIRKRYKIRGSCFDDYMTTLCCPCCDLVQGQLEIEAEEKFYGGGRSHNRNRSGSESNNVMEEIGRELVNQAIQS
ncbi:PLAC8 family-domain-containing protein [Cyathus striatus]|nr:PLAC8 family-domain-containing protein [Cyathus striatus]